MKIETFIVCLEATNKGYAEKISGSVFKSTEELESKLYLDGVKSLTVENLEEFQKEWNGVYDNTDRILDLFQTSILSYVYIIK